MKIKYGIATAIIALPILFSHMAVAGASGIPTWSGNNLDDWKREDTTHQAAAVQSAQNVQAVEAKQSTSTSTGVNAPFWSGNTIATK